MCFERAQITRHGSTSQNPIRGQSGFLTISRFAVNLTDIES